jgi:dolichol-phosphate mannosyltransferase
MESEPRVHLISRPGKMGLGSAYVSGFKYALANGYDYILEMDADFSHNPNDIPRLLEEARKYDLVIGSRYCQGVNIVNWPFKRLLISYFASKYVRAITGMPVKDPTGGFKCFNRRVLEAINLDRILSDGYAFQIEMNFRAWVKGFRVHEVPIVFTERIDGVSKMSRRIVWEAVWMVWRLQIMICPDCSLIVEPQVPRAEAWRANPAPAYRRGHRGKPPIPQPRRHPLPTPCPAGWCS